MFNGIVTQQPMLSNPRLNKTQSFTFTFPFLSPAFKSCYLSLVINFISLHMKKQKQAIMQFITIFYPIFMSLMYKRIHFLPFQRFELHLVRTGIIKSNHD